MGRTVQTSRKKAKGHKYDHKYSNAPRHVAVPRSLGAGTPPGAVKYLSTTPAFSGVADSPAELAANTGILNIAAIPKGVGAQERKYNKAFMKSIAVRGRVRLQAASGVASGCVFLVYDRNRNQRSTMTMAEILSQAISLGNAGYNELSLTEPNGAPRFKILRRWPYCIASATAAGAGLPPIVYLDAFVNLKNKTLSWTNDDTTGASDKSMDGPLYFVHVSSYVNTAGVADAPVFEGIARLYFADP